MYIPPAYEESRLEVLHAFIRQYSFATLVTQGNAGLTASHLPFLLDTSRGQQGVLRSHVARPNAQWKDLNLEGEALVIFQGPHAYISPRWYVEKVTVPTWNYAAVHVYGRPR